MRQIMLMAAVILVFGLFVVSGCAEDNKVESGSPITKDSWAQVEGWTGTFTLTYAVDFKETEKVAYISKSHTAQSNVTGWVNWEKAGDYSFFGESGANGSYYQKIVREVQQPEGHIITITVTGQGSGDVTGSGYLHIDPTQGTYMMRFQLSDMQGEAGGTYGTGPDKWHFGYDKIDDQPLPEDSLTLRGSITYTHLHWWQDATVTVTW